MVCWGGSRFVWRIRCCGNSGMKSGRTNVYMPRQRVLAKAERLRGTAGFVVPSLDELKKRLDHAGREMKRVIPERKTQFNWREKDGAVEATDPWGTRVRCHAPSPEYGPTELGLVYVDFDVPPGAAEGIARFYTEVMDAPAQALRGR